MTDSLGSQPSATATENGNQQPPATESEWSVDDVNISPPATSLPPVTVPDGERYPTMGSGDETVTLYGNWKCPYTREFVQTQLPALVDEFVRPGDLSIRFRAVAYRGGEPFLGPDAPQSARAGLAVWESDPKSFWTYFMTVFANQPQERYQWGTPELLTRFAGSAGVENLGAIRTAAAGDTYESRLQQTVASARRLDLWSVPRVVYEGQVTAPTLDAERTREQLARAADS
jgi:protein-disulfide isomerase